MTLYEALGVPEDARGPEITKAYNRLVEEFGKVTTAPDPRREALMRTAYETLLDPARRAEYDASLVGLLQNWFDKRCDWTIARSAGSEHTQQDALAERLHGQQ